MKKLLNTKLKDMKAITLIALVITIVVLIILAGVIISITLGNGGIIDRAKLAKQEYANAEGYEQEQIAKASNQIDEYVDNVRDASGEISITKNGNYDVSKYATANVNVSLTPVQVATITTDNRSATYTMQNDGYILGTSGTLTSNGTGAYINFTKNGTTQTVFTTDYRDSNLYTISLYATEGTKISVRNNGGVYNLTVYEWK